MNRWPRNKSLSAQSIYRVYGHLFLTASTFVTIFTFSWVISLLVDYLISIHKVQSAISTMVDKLEVGLFYWDFVWCGLLISRDMIRVLLKGGRGQINVEEDV